MNELARYIIVTSQKRNSEQKNQVSQWWASYAIYIKFENRNNPFIHCLFTHTQVVIDKNMAGSNEYQIQDSVTSGEKEGKEMGEMHRGFSCLKYFIS